MPALRPAASPAVRLRSLGGPANTTDPAVAHARSPQVQAAAAARPTSGPPLEGSGQGPSAAARVEASAAAAVAAVPRAAASRGDRGGERRAGSWAGTLTACRQRPWAVGGAALGAAVCAVLVVVEGGVPRLRQP